MEDLDGAMICTIHSYCQHLLEREFQAVGVDARLRVCKDQEAIPLMDRAFRDAFPEMGFCLDCIPPLVEMAGEELSGEDMRALLAALKEGTGKLLAEEEKNLKNFTLLFDYRNAGKTIEGTKGALEKAVNTLRGKCLDEPS